MNKTAQRSSTPLQNLAKRLESNSDFMAYVIAIYKKQENLTEEALASQWKVNESTLTRLALCKRPNSDSLQFAEQIQQIAAFVRIDPSKLASVVRQVESLESLMKQPQRLESTETESIGVLRSGLLAAARDRDEPDEDESPAEKKSPTENDWQ